jgi:hypothetical protein
VREVIATTEIDAARPILPGRPTHYLPSLGLEDTVHVAGPSGLVDAVKRKARSAAARCYADAFLPSAAAPSLVDRVMQILRTPAGEAADAEVLSPRPRGLGWVFRPFAGAVSRQPATGGRVLRPAPSAVSQPRGTRSGDLT